MKKRTTYRIVSVLIASTVLIIYGTYNYKEDKKSVSNIIRMASKENGSAIIDEIGKNRHLSNPIANIRYHFYKKKFSARFIDQNEKYNFESTSKIINDISNIYRAYWRTEFLKQNSSDRTDSLLYMNLSKYLTNNNLTSIPYDSLLINPTEEIEKVIVQEGLYCEFFSINGFKDILIWEKQNEKEYKIELPNDTVNVSVIFLENTILRGHIEYFTFGRSEIGGWHSASQSKLFCNTGNYDFDSEKYRISYLKHEATHFIDKEKFPNLSYADKEYRAKLVELIYCDKTIYDRIDDFLNGASVENRNHSHPYANYTIIQNLSKILFNNDFECDMSEWESIASEKINQAAEKLFLDNCEALSKIKNPTKVI